MIVCRNCFYAGHSPLPLCNECGDRNIVRIDDEFVPFVITFWKLGLDTSRWCSGHYRPINDRAYIGIEEQIRRYQRQYITFDFETYDAADQFVEKYKNDNDTKVNFGISETFHFGSIRNEATPNLYVTKRSAPALSNGEFTIKYQVTVYGNTIKDYGMPTSHLISMHYDNITNFWKFMCKLILDYEDNSSRSEDIE